MGDKHENTQLIAVMSRFGVSNSGLANRIRRLSEERDPKNALRTDHVTVKKWRDGTPPKPDTAQLIVEVLSHVAGERVTLADVGFAAGGEQDSAMALEYPASLAESVVRLGVLARRDLSGDTHFADQPASPDSLTQPMLLWMLARPEGQHGHKGSLLRVGMADVEAIRETTRMFAKLDFRYGGGHARSALVQFFTQDVAPLLDGSYNAEVGRQLYVAASEVAEVLGWTAYDLGRHGLAQRYLVQSLRLAQAANDRILAARAMAELSHQANYLGNYQAAAQLARAAQEGARSTVTPAAMSMFQCYEARAMAGAGDERAVSTALNEAEASFERSDPASEPDWLDFFDAAELAGEAAHCFRDLRSPARTQEFVTRAVELTLPAYARTLAFVRLVQASAFAQDGQPEHAAEIMADVVEEAGPLKSERYLRYVRDLLIDLRPYSTSTEVKAAIRVVRQRNPRILTES
jgi:hypothetical protein